MMLLNLILTLELLNRLKGENLRQVISQHSSGFNLLSIENYIRLIFHFYFFLFEIKFRSSLAG